MPETDIPPDCIIVADSEVIIRNVIADYLRQCGYKVIDAANADEVVAVLDSAFTDVHAILCDAGLTGAMNGFALRLWVRERHPDIQFIMAGNVAAAAEAAGQLCEAGPHLARPYEPQTVLAQIRRLLAAIRS